MSDQDEEEDSEESTKKLLKSYIEIGDKAVIEKAVEVELKNIENEAENMELLEINKGLAQFLDEKDRELVDKCKQIQEQESKLNVVNKQLEEERTRLNTAKSLLKKEIAKRKKLISDSIPSEKEIDLELESS